MTVRLIIDVGHARPAPEHDVTAIPHGDGGLTATGAAALGEEGRRAPDDRVRQREAGRT